MNELYTKDEVLDLIKEAAAAGARAALAEQGRRRHQSMKAWQDAKRRNAKLLLTHYHEFKASAENSVYREGATQEDEVKAEVLDGLMNGSVDKNSIIVKSIRDSAVRTQIIVQHIDKMLDIFEQLAQKRHNSRPELMQAYSCIRCTYIEEGDPGVDVICARLNVSRASYYRYLAAGYETMGDLLFGIDYEATRNSAV